MENEEVAFMYTFSYQESHKLKMNELKSKKIAKEEELSSLQAKVMHLILIHLQLEETTNNLQTLHSQATLAAQGLSEKDILDEQSRGEVLMKELAQLKVSFTYDIKSQEEENQYASSQQPSKSTKGVSRLVLDETKKQLQNSKRRLAELQERLEVLKSEQKEESNIDISVNVEDLKSKIATMEAEETKVLRRLYLLIKQIKGSIHSECLLRVADVVSQNATVCINNDNLERLLPFSQERVVKLLSDFLNAFSVCLVIHSFQTCGITSVSLIRQWH